MYRAEYDDWNTDTVLTSKPEKKTDFNKVFNSYCIFCAAALLLIIGLISLYSASFSVALESGLPNYFFLIRQLIRVLFSFVVAAVLLFMSQQIIEAICPILMIVCIAVQGVNFFVKSPIILTETSISLLFIVSIMYISLFFANRENGIERLRELILPILFLLIFIASIFVQENFTFGLLYIFEIILLFAYGGMSFWGVTLLILFAVVPIATYAFRDVDLIQKIINVFSYGYYSDSAEIAYSRELIASGGLFGKGLGNGFASSGLSGNFAEKIYQERIFCNVAREFGLLGIIFIFLLFLIIIVCAFRSASHLRSTNRFYSNFSFGISVLFTLQFVLNICSALGIISLDISMPFFSYSEFIVITVIECVLLYKMSMANSDTEITNKFTENDYNTYEVSYES